ncbi:ATP-binding cassette domain-containing protein [Carnobacterium divergens]|uniref:ATP-binding cassette domain-containing protein n=1 Tax=Carnobacterium divergens TaxID=2748 RepID=UPI0039AF24B5
MILICENVSKSIQKKDILKNIQFKLRENEIVGLVGPNGAGKTTLMKLMVGLSSSSTGSIRLNDFDIKKIF